MARMYPRTLVESDESKSEIKVFEALRDGLLRRVGGLPLCELDDPRPRRGCQGRRDRLRPLPSGEGNPLPRGQGERDRVQARRMVAPLRGQARADQGPFKQAIDHTHALRRKIEKQPGWKKRKPFVGARVCVFPHGDHPPALARPGCDAEILIDRHGLDDIEAAIERRARLPPEARATSASSPARKAPTCSAIFWLPTYDRGADGGGVPG